MSDTKWFTWLRRPITMSDVLEEEVDDRENFTRKEVQSWMLKYRLNGESRVIWGMSFEAAKKEAEYWEGEGAEPRPLDPGEYDVPKFEEIPESLDELDGRRLLILVR